MTTVTVSAVDNATPALEQAMRSIIQSRVQRAVGTACAVLTRNHLLAMPPNRNGWPSTGFWQGCARGTDWSSTNDGVVISVDNAEKPGAARYQYQGGTINMKDKLLTIPARAEAYGVKATDFDNLRFAMFKSGAKALVIGKGGTGLVDFRTGRSKAVRGSGARSALMVMYWLVPSVSKDANPDVLPSNEEYVGTAKGVVLELWANRRNN